MFLIILFNFIMMYDTNPRLFYFKQFDQGKSSIKINTAWCGFGARGLMQAL